MPSWRLHVLTFVPAAQLRGALCGVGVLLVSAGCVKREIEITSSPAGAQVLLNGREVGRTPTVIEFTFDGTYDVRLRLDGYDAVVGAGTTHAPVWDFVGADLVAELWPADLHRTDRWHFELVPEATAEVGLQQRADEMRAASAAQPDSVEGAPPTRSELKGNVKAVTGPAVKPAPSPATAK